MTISVKKRADGAFMKESMAGECNFPDSPKP